MKIEHIALNVENPIEMTKWYVEHLGMKVVRQEETPPYTTFMSDSGGEMMIEVYQNPKDQIPDYRAMNPLLLHVAFVSEKPDIEKGLLLEAGASEVSDEELADGSRIIMLRDPWGLAIQLCRRNL